MELLVQLDPAWRQAGKGLRADWQTEKALTEYKQQSKLVFRRLNANSEPACSIESGQYTLQWVSPSRT